MELDGRKLKILQAIIQNYLETGEPVGSRTISKIQDMNLSSATIRNEMSDLEDLGLIMQPYTSAGRIPTDTGYRLYVDRLIQEKNEEAKAKEEKLLKKVDRLEAMVSEMAEVLARTTEYASMVSLPTSRDPKVRFLQLSRPDPLRLLLTVVMEGDKIHHTMVDLQKDLEDQELLALNILLNKSMSGRSLREMNLEMITDLKRDAGKYAPLVGRVIELLSDTIRMEESMPRIFTSGASNVFKYPELSQGEGVETLIHAFEEKEPLRDLVQKVSETEDSDIQIYIGQETPVESMKDYSIVTANYSLGEGMQGVFAVIGPKRMNYRKVLHTVQKLLKEFDGLKQGRDRPSLPDASHSAKDE